LYIHVCCNADIVPPLAPLPQLEEIDEIDDIQPSQPPHQRKNKRRKPPPPKPSQPTSLVSPPRQAGHHQETRANRAKAALLDLSERPKYLQTYATVKFHDPRPSSVGMPSLHKWTAAERTVKRRLIAFHCISTEETFTGSFSAVAIGHFADAPPDSKVVSCILIPDLISGQKCIITSYDLINLVDWMIHSPNWFDVNERNRVRRNLELFKPQTLRKNGAFDGFNIFDQVTGYLYPKPWNIQKDFKVFDWAQIETIMVDIVKRYHIITDRPEEGINEEEDTYALMESAGQSLREAMESEELMNIGVEEVEFGSLDFLNPQESQFLETLDDAGLQESTLVQNQLEMPGHGCEELPWNGPEPNWTQTTTGQSQIPTTQTEVPSMLGIMRQNTLFGNLQQQSSTSFELSQFENGLEGLSYSLDTGAYFTGPLQQAPFYVYTPPISPVLIQNWQQIRFAQLNYNALEYTAQPLISPQATQDDLPLQEFLAALDYSTTQEYEPIQDFPSTQDYPPIQGDVNFNYTAEVHSQAPSTATISPHLSEIRITPQESRVNSDTPDTPQSERQMMSDSFQDVSESMDYPVDSESARDAFLEDQDLDEVMADVTEGADESLPPGGQDGYTEETELFPTEEEPPSHFEEELANIGAVSGGFSDML
jgi:hypothetical protein